MPSTKVKEFSKEFWGSQVDTYYDVFSRKECCNRNSLEELVEACLGHSEDSDDDALDANLSILDNVCAHIFNFVTQSNPILDLTFHMIHFFAFSIFSSLSIAFPLFLALQ